jgi:F-type H+-transporting ATPase subunit delta
MKTSKQARRDAKQLFRMVQVNGELDENKVRQAVKAVLDARPRGFLAILAQFTRLVRLDLDRRSARIESAVPLDPAMRAKVEADLARLYGNRLNLQYVENPALLGGLRIQVGSDVYDGSVQRRLAELQEKF